MVDAKVVEKPWGNYQVLQEGLHYKVKNILVNAGEQLSLQVHEHRAENWVVVHGTANVIRGAKLSNLKTTQLSVQESIIIPKKWIHSLVNVGLQPLVVIEVQHGSYLGEDDIQRFEDKYGRA
jgi:mannose-6-phosphate isomerase-like protein (cupin superfamily)